MSTETSEPVDAPAVDAEISGEITMRAGLRSLVECCRIIEEGVGNAREIDLGMMTGAGIAPGPLVRADDAGLDNILQGLEYAQQQWGEGFAPPTLLKRLVAQGRLGKKTGQGFFAYPQPDGGEQTENVLLETRGPVAIAWLAQQPVNPISPELVRDLQGTYDRVNADASIRTLVIASSTNAIFSAGADLKAFSKMSVGEAGTHLDNTNKIFRDLEKGRLVTIACINGAALGGGCELTMACNLRIAGESASFGQPEISLGILPGFGGTQRLPRLIGKTAAFELMTTGDTIDAWRAAELGLVNHVAADHELFDSTISLAERLAAQAPIAIQEIKGCLDDPTLDDGIAREREAFVRAFGSEDAREGVGAFLQKRAPRFTGK
jgi:enoyl-CoA hydratase/3-hydroxyacyl-CoA dehydrogenase